MQALFSYHSAINTTCLVGTKHLMQRWRCLHQKVSFDTYPGQLMLPSFVGHIQLCLRALWLPWLICFLALSSNLLLPRMFFFFGSNGLYTNHSYLQLGLVRKVTRDFLLFFMLCPSQYSPNLFRIVNSVASINKKKNECYPYSPQCQPYKRKNECQHL